MQTTTAILKALLEKAQGADPHAAALLDMVTKSRHTRVEAHPLGMAALRFRCQNFTIRVHVWSPRTLGFRDEFAQVHDHTWHLESHILAGRIHNYVFDLVDAPGGEEIWVHDYDRDELVRSDRRVALRHRYEEVLSTGGSYELRAGTVHSSSVAPGTITLVKSIPTALRVARIIGASDSARQRPAGRGLVDLDQVLEDIRAAS
jgi:hypothetical protein